MKIREIAEASMSYILAADGAWGLGPSSFLKFLVGFERCMFYVMAVRDSAGFHGETAVFNGSLPRYTSVPLNSFILFTLYAKLNWHPACQF